MKSLGKRIVWLILLNKRLLKKPIFLILLCCIPLATAAVNFMAKQESGFFTIVLCSEDPNDPTAQAVMETLTEHDDAVRFHITESEVEAIQFVEAGQADAAWVFPVDLQGKIEAYIGEKNVKDGVITVIEKEDNVALKLSREILFARLYPTVSYCLYSEFIRKEFLPDGQFTDEELRENYEQIDVDGNLFEFRFQDGTKPSEDMTYLMSSVRGILALLIVLCGLAMGMYFIQDERAGLFIRMPLHKSVFWGWLYRMPVLLDVGIVTLISLLFVGVFTDWLTEIVTMFLFLWMVAGFSDTVKRVCGSITVMGAVIPVLMLIMLVFSPVFASVTVCRPVQFLLPTYYYLNAIHNKSFLVWMAVYIAVVFLVNLVLQKMEGYFKKD